MNRQKEKELIRDIICEEVFVMKCHDCDHARDIITKEIHDILKKNTTIQVPEIGTVSCAIEHKYVTPRKKCEYWKEIDVDDEDSFW